MNLGDLMNQLAEDVDARLLRDPDEIRRTGESLRHQRRVRLTIGAAVVTVLALVATLAIITRDAGRSAPEPISPTPSQAPPLAYVGASGGIWSHTTDENSNWLGQGSLFAACGEPCFPFDLEWSPDGRTLAVLTGPPCCLERGGVSVLLMSRGGADARRVFACPPDSRCALGFPRQLTWSQESQEVAITVNKELYRVPVDGGDPGLACSCAALDPTYLPDGRLAYVGLGQLRAQDPASGQTATLATVAGITGAQWSPDRRFAVVSVDDTSLSVMDMSVSPPVRVEPHRVAGLAPRWAPDGGRFVYFTQSGHNLTTYRPELWIAAPGERPRLLHRFPRNGGWAPPTWSPDGTRVAQWIGDGERSGTLWILDAATGKVLSTVKPAEGAAAWEPAPGAQQ